MQTSRVTIVISLGVAAVLFAATPARSVTPSADLIKCQKQLEKVSAFAKFAAKKIHICAEKVVACNLASEIDAVSPTNCLARASTACSAIPGAVTASRTTRRTKVLNKCGLIPLADVEAFIAGLGFFNEANDCAALAPPLTPITVSSVPDLVDCVLATSQCSAEREVLTRDPRALDSLTTGGVAGSFPCVGM